MNGKVKKFLARNKRGIIFGVSGLLAIVVLVSVSLFMVHSNNEKKLRALEESYMMQIEEIEIPELLELEIKDESYDEKLVSSQTETLDSSIEETQSLIDKISGDSNLEGSPMLGDLISSSEEKLELLTDMKSDLLSQEQDIIKEIAKLEKDRKEKEREKEEKKLAEEKAKKKKEEKEKKDQEKEEKSLASNEQNSSSSSTGSQKKSSNSNKSSSGSSKSSNSSSKKSSGESSNKDSSGEKKEPKKQSYKKPAYGEITRSNPYYDSNGKNMEDYPYEWEFGEYYFIYDEEEEYWSAWIRFGMNVTDRGRWEEAVENAYPYPSDNGKKDGEVRNKDRGIWIYFGG